MVSTQKPRIKICGLKDKATIIAMDGLAIHEIGLVFAPSKRQVTIEQAKGLVEAIHQIHNHEGNAPRAVGVFVNEPLASIAEVIKRTNVDVVQLHGKESVQYTKQLKELFPKIAIWKVVSIKEQLLDINGWQDELQPFSPYIEALLIDAPGGGTGKPFNWEAIQAFYSIASQLHISLYVAGGLNQDNVRALLEEHQMHGIDVSSGVETDGVKDINKIHQFIGKVIEA